jgi:Winged helix DNA-binding domain
VRITAGELNRATLARQLLLSREALSATDAVRRVAALQAQQPASPYLALWNRVSGFDPGELDAAFAGHQVVGAQLMRITMHAVHAEDHQAFRAGGCRCWSGATWRASARRRSRTWRGSRCPRLRPGSCPLVDIGSCCARVLD